MTYRFLCSKALIAAALALPLALSNATPAHAAVIISVGFAPPVLPVYTQPLCPGPGYLWTPGYWGYGAGGYYWVPGVWVVPPQEGLLWTPAYWGWEGGHYLFHGGYWGSHVGFYGGVNYGFGYTGAGFFGGEWRGRSFFYNRTVNNINVTNVTNVYNRTVVVNNRSTVAYNGGPGGLQYRPSTAEANFTREQHFQPTSNQQSHEQFAAQNRGQFASTNGGRPGVPAATSVNSFRSNSNNAAAAARPTVNGRETNQDQRLANGMRSGQITSGEAARADQRQAGIDQQVHNDRVANGGALTPAERQQVGREQNRASQQISRENHNGNTANPNGVVNQREVNQEQRIANGQRSGQMTSGEAARANQRQANIDQQIHNERVAGGGRLNGAERGQVGREQNGASRQIERETHNGEHRPR